MHRLAVDQHHRRVAIACALLTPAAWAQHVKQAAQFALQALDAAFPQAAPFTFDNTRIIAVGISNGGGGRC